MSQGAVAGDAAGWVPKFVPVTVIVGAAGVPLTATDVIVTVAADAGGAPPIATAAPRATSPVAQPSLRRMPYPASSS